MNLWPAYETKASLVSLLHRPVRVWAPRTVNQLSTQKMLSFFDEVGGEKEFHLNSFKTKLCGNSCPLTGSSTRTYFYLYSID
jgi:hypothetical protein